MKPQFRLLSFEELIATLKHHGFADRLDTLMKVRVFSTETSPETDLSLSNECREKYSGTWWEILWPLPHNSADQLQCFYVADSLRDALRLRPQIDLSFWAGPCETLTQYLALTKDWIEEMEEAEIAD